MGKKSRQINISLNNLIYPYFVRTGVNKKETIRDFPKIFRFSIDRLLKDIEETLNLGINKILLFGIPDKKDIFGSGAFKEGNVVALAVKEINKFFPDLTVMTDICLCAYTTHGHCGILKAQSAKRKAKNEINIDSRATLETLAKITVSHAEAGADFVAPSAMAKGQVLAIRKTLDANGFGKTKIMGYSAKFASNFYGPFRSAADSAAKFGDRSSYQLSFDNAKKALAEIAEDIKEGADIVMVKPALSYLDIIAKARLRFDKPLAAYNVSGEYAMLKAYVNNITQSAKRTALEKKIIMEILTGIKRAGADLIITYHAKDVAKWLKE